MHKKRTKDLVLKKSWPRILWISDRHSSTDLESSILPRFGLPIKTLDFIRMKTSASLLFFSEETPIPGAQMAMCCTWIISRSPRDHDLLNLSSPLALHQKKNTEKLRTFFFQNRTDRTSAPCGAGRWAVPSCLACFKSNSRTLTFGILIAPIRFSEVKMVPELSVRLLKGVMSGTCGGIKVSNSLTAQLR